MADLLDRRTEPLVLPGKVFGFLRAIFKVHPSTSQLPANRSPIAGCLL